MAKTPPKKTTLKAKKATAAKAAGYTGKTATEAQKSVTVQYGLVKDASGNWVKPDAAFLERQMVANGWGAGQTGVTPVSIGGQRWLTGQGQLTYTGERSDAAKHDPGKAWGGLTEGQPAGGTSTGQGLAASSASGSLAAPWENTDFAGGGIPLTAQGAAGADEAGPATGGKNNKGRKKAKKATRAAKSNKSPGGSKVTAKERARIKAIKARNRGK